MKTVIVKMMCGNENSYCENSYCENDVVMKTVIVKMMW